MNIENEFILSRSPMRISFIGGGTDYKSYFENSIGRVISSTVDRFVYVASLPHAHFVPDRFKFTYRVTESVASVDLLQHPVLRAALQDLKWHEPLNIATMADLPGRTGLGSSSAFSNSLLLNLHTRLGRNISATQLAKDAIRLERNLLKEPGGWQDQVASAVGGFNYICFHDDKFSVEQLHISSEASEWISKFLYLINTGKVRRNSESSWLMQRSVSQRLSFVELNQLSDYVKIFWPRLKWAPGKHELLDVIREMVSIGWDLKKRFHPDLLTETTTRHLSQFLESKDIPHKITGSGGGGFIFAILSPDECEEVSDYIGTENLYRINLWPKGTELVFRN